MTPEPTDIKVLIIEDHAMLAQGLSLVLRQEGYNVEIADTRDRDDILVAAKSLSPRVILLDLHLGDAVGSSVSLIPSLRDQGAQVVMLTGEEDQVRLAECVAAGASGLVHKTEALEEIIEVVDRAARGEPLLSPGKREKLLDALRAGRAEEKLRLSPFETLTAREQEVLGVLMAGQSAKTFAASAHLSMPTVRTHIRAILQKLGVASQLQAVAMARQAGWKPPTG